MSADAMFEEALKQQDSKPSGADAMFEEAASSPDGALEKTPEPTTFDKIKEGAGAAAQGGLQGITFGFGDELKGLVGALVGRGYKGRDASFMDDYRTVRDEARRDRAHAEEKHPVLYNGALVGSALLTPGASAKTAGGLLKSAVLGGGAYGLGSSEADVTKGDVLGAAKDTGVGAGLGLAGGLALKGGAALAQKGAQKLTNVARAATAKGEAMAQKPIDAAIRSASGALGGESSAGNRAIDVLSEALSDPNAPAELRARAAELLSGPQTRALKDKILQNTINGFESRLPRIDKAEGALQDALGRGTPEARKAAIEEFFSRSPLKRATGEIAKRILPTIVGSTLGGAVGGTTGAGVGGGIGLISGAMSGAPGRIIKNAIWSPQTQRSVGETGASILNKLAPDQLEPYLRLLRAAEAEQ